MELDVRKRSSPPASDGASTVPSVSSSAAAPSTGAVKGDVKYSRLDEKAHEDMEVWGGEDGTIS